MISPDDLLRAYVDEARASSRRVRWAAIIVLVASVTLFAATWNIRPNNWMTVRMKQLTAAVQDENNSEELRQLAARALAKMQEESLSKMSVVMPFFGVRFDVNDLGMVGGVSLFIAMYILYQSTRSELRNVRIVLAEARNLNFFLGCYQLLAMSQVLTIVPTEADPEPGLVRHASKLLYLLPIGAMSYLLYRDLDTVKDAYAAAPKMTMGLMTCTVLTTLGIVLLSALAIWNNHKLDVAWKTSFDQYQREKNAANRPVDEEGKAGTLLQQAG